uniref:Reverse transcriptase domain-containing protein n=1 Tax=Anopheles atroparvus TaxID=41427 RepID=A0A182J8A4_ANOAO
LPATARSWAFSHILLELSLHADITEMFHQEQIAEQDVNSQRFLWRWGNANQSPEEYVMLRMTFGAACSPSAAQFVKNTNAERFRKQYPKAVLCIIENHYVDDMLCSVEREEEAILLAREVTFIHRQAGFELHHWLSNSTCILQSIGTSAAVEKELVPGSPAMRTEKVLGMWWNTETDVFCFKLTRAKLNELHRGNKPPTKRQMLKTLMSIYDPLGLIAAALLYLKALVQDAWQAGLDWEEEVDPAIAERWTRGTEHLPSLGGAWGDPAWNRYQFLDATAESLPWTARYSYTFWLLLVRRATWLSCISVFSKDQQSRCLWWVRRPR